MASKNNPKNKGEQTVVEGQVCEICGSDKGVHRVKRMKTMMWLCKDDKCPRFK